MSQQGSGGEKTEKASAKKKRDARKKGEVHKSQDFGSSLMLFILFGALKLGYDDFITNLTQFVSQRMSGRAISAASAVNAPIVLQGYKETLFDALPLVLPLMLAAMTGGALIDVVQTGPLFVPAKLKPDFKRISPIQGFKRIFSLHTLVGLVKSLVKLAILGVILYKSLLNCLAAFSAMIYVDAAKSFSLIMSECFAMGINMGLGLTAFALLDIFYQWWKYERDLKMTKQEVKEEFKQTEGDPKVKGYIKRRRQKMSGMRMMKQLAEADVVITNPEHYAVALRYKEGLDNAPVVVAKGRDYLARKIKERARKYRISIVENKPVARALYAACQVGDEIPPELYQAIADILIYVYQVLGKKKP